MEHVDIIARHQPKAVMNINGSIDIHGVTPQVVALVAKWLNDNGAYKEVVIDGKHYIVEVHELIYLD